MELTKFVDFGSFVKRSPDVSIAKAFYRNESTYQIVREEEKKAVWTIVQLHSFQILLVRLLLQHSVVGADSEMFRYLKVIQGQTIKVVSSETLARLIIVIKITYNGTCQLHY